MKDLIKDNQKYFNRLQVVLDAVVVIVSYLTAWYIVFRSVRRGGIGFLPAEFYMMALILIVPYFLLLYYACSLYTPKQIGRAHV